MSGMSVDCIQNNIILCRGQDGYCCHFCKLEFLSTLIFADEQLIRRDIISWQSLVCFIQYPVVGGLTPS